MSKANVTKLISDIIYAEFNDGIQELHNLPAIDSGEDFNLRIANGTEICRWDFISSLDSSILTESLCATVKNFILLEMADHYHDTMTECFGHAYTAPEILDDLYQVMLDHPLDAIDFFREGKFTIDWAVDYIHDHLMDDALRLAIPKIAETLNENAENKRIINRYLLHKTYEVTLSCYVLAENEDQAVDKANEEISVNGVEYLVDGDCDSYDEYESDWDAECENDNVNPEDYEMDDYTYSVDYDD